MLYELRQNDDKLNASVQLSLSSAYEELATIQIENPYFQKSLATAFISPEDMTVDDMMSVMSWRYRYLLVLHTTYQLRNAGVIDDATWREKVGHFTVYIQYPGMYKLFKDGAHDEFFSREFYAEIEAILTAQKAAMALRSE